MRQRLVALASICALLGPTGRASACGGLFCSSAPVVQSGEEIVYAMQDDGSLTMSVRIFYAGIDTDIAWILPLPAPPEVSLGSQALFTQLRGATQPAFVVRRETTGICREHPACVTQSGATSPAYGGGGCGYSTGGGGGGWSGGYVDAGPPRDAGRVVASDTGGLPHGGVVVFSREAVGPYDTVVLGAASALEVTTWLADNGYQLPAGTTERLDPYATTGHVFIAVRLAPGHGVSEIAPVTLHLPVPSPCLPIRLTALATAPDLPITAWFLGRARTVPANFSVATPRYDDERYWTQAGFYAAQTTREIGAAGGQAFVTEYAGPTPALALVPPALGDTSMLSASELVRRLLAGGYFPTQADALRILAAHVTAPSGESTTTWINAWTSCLSGPQGTRCPEPDGADLLGLLAQVESELVAPRRAAQALIDAHPYLTRMFTSLSAEQMTLDPEFRTDPALHDVSAVHVELVSTRCDSEHYAEDASIVTTLDGAPLRTAAGTLADDAAYCHRAGLYLPSEAHAPSTHRGWCGCRAGRQPFGLWPFAMLLGVVGWRRARRRSRRHAERDPALVSRAESTSAINSSGSSRPTA